MVECGVCKKPVVSGLTVSIGKELFHAECFKCHECQSQLEGAFVVVENNRVCKECFNKNAPTCAECNQKILENFTKTGEGKKFHPICFKCDKCGQLLTKAFRKNRLGKYEHPNCLHPNDELLCSDCGKTLLELKFFPIGANKNACDLCYQKNHSRICHGCKKKILEVCCEYVNEWKFHSRCFNCARPGCGKSLEGIEVKIDGEDVVCMNCNPEKGVACRKVI